MSRPTPNPSVRAKPASASHGRLNPGMACDTAFRIVARRHLDALLADHDGTCRGDPDALHRIRIALTHLRTAIRFFSPMVNDALRPGIWAELKWLNNQLGMTRDLDVAIDRIVAETGNELAVIAELQPWDQKRAESHRLLARALQSARYRRLVEQTAAWIESGPWSTRRGKEAIRLRRCSLAGHATARLAEWEKMLLMKARRLGKLDARKWHRLRLLNERLTYSIESLEDLFAEEMLAKQKSVLKQLCKAQRCLEQLNDETRRQALAASLNGLGPDAGVHFLDRKREKRLLRTAKAAHQKLDKAKPSSDLMRSPDPA